MMKRITLTESDRKLAEAVGAKRHGEHKRRRTPHKFGANARYLEQEVTSIGAEIAVAKLLGKEWIDRTISQDREGDVCPGVQVRYNSFKFGADLRLQPTDAEDHVFFLVTGDYPKFEVRGWAVCGEVRRSEFWRELQKGRPCYCVPQALLKTTISGRLAELLGDDSLEAAA